jgi:hypothetical protein
MLLFRSRERPDPNREMQLQQRPSVPTQYDVFTCSLPQKPRALPRPDPTRLNSKQQADLDRALEIALKRLENSPECREYLSGLLSGNPLGVLQEFKRNNQFSYGCQSDDYVAWASTIGKRGNIFLYNHFFTAGVGGVRREFALFELCPRNSLIFDRSLGEGLTRLFSQ